MNAAKHTAGPWHFDPADMDDAEALTIGIAAARVDGEDEAIGFAVGFIAEERAPGVWGAGVRGDIETVRANARVMTAAPVLLAALESAKHMLERDYIDDAKLAVIEKCDAAITAATEVAS